MKNSTYSSSPGVVPSGAGPHQPPPCGAPPVLVQGAVFPPPDRRFLMNRKSLLEAYAYCFLFGLFGVHHFYLKRPFFGMMYLFTLGLFGIGWIIDLFRLPWLVEEANREEEEIVLRGYSAARLQTVRFMDLRDRTVLEAYMMWFPMGIFGFHHFYLGRLGFGVTYCCTAGLGCVGWLVDLFRIPSLVRDTNEKLRAMRSGQNVPVNLECSVGDAYQLAFPLGFLGLHHFFMGRIGQGLAYLFTGGLLGVGWLADLVRMPCLVHRHNKEVREQTTWKRHLDDAYIYVFPFGILGFHRFYLSGPAVGLLYFFTAGLFLVGWLVDLVRMPCLVKAVNDKLKMYSEMYPNNQVYIFQPSPQSQYGATWGGGHHQTPYPAQQGNVTYSSYNQPSNPYGSINPMPVPSNPLPSTYIGPPPNPPPYGGPASLHPPQYDDAGGPQADAELPPPYQVMDNPSSASAPPADCKPEEPET